MSKQAKEKRAKYYKTHQKLVDGIYSRYIQSHPWVQKLLGARSRCNNPKYASYKWYGGKDIKCLLTTDEIKKLWFRDKAYQLNWASLDRINPKDNYTFKNCRFIEMSQNSKRGKYKFTDDK